MKKDPGLTTADLVLLSLLAEQPMHGYQANAELERREVRDWAGISRPQIYYPSKARATANVAGYYHQKPAAGPERAIFAITARGKATLADALERTRLVHPTPAVAFLTWMALSLAGPQGRIRATTKQARRISAARVAKRARHTRLCPGRSRPCPSRSSLDAQADDRAIRNRASLARQCSPRNQAPSRRQTPSAGLFVNTHELFSTPQKEAALAINKSRSFIDSFP